MAKKNKQPEKTHEYRKKGAKEWRECTKEQADELAKPHYWGGYEVREKVIPTPDSSSEIK